MLDVGGELYKVLLEHGSGTSSCPCGGGEHAMQDGVGVWGGGMGGVVGFISTEEEGEEDAGWTVTNDDDVCAGRQEWW